jgi:hypothetical protein
MVIKVVRYPIWDPTLSPLGALSFFLINFFPVKKKKKKENSFPPPQKIMPPMYQKLQFVRLTVFNSLYAMDMSKNVTSLVG